MSLMLHAGAEPVEVSALPSVPIPEATDSHVPIPHCDFIDFVKMALKVKGHEVTWEEYGVTPDGMEFFGVMKLASDYGDYTDVVGLRNSNSKKFPVGVSAGSSVFVCDNLAFMGDHVVRRRHTAKLLRDLPGLVMEMISPLTDVREKQYRTIQIYKETDIDQAVADHAVIEAFRNGVLPWAHLQKVINEWENPTHDEFSDRTAWSLFNAFTHVLAGRVAANPKATQNLHTVIDGVCARIS